jgi:hypothetical protein
MADNVSPDPAEQRAPSGAQVEAGHPPRHASPENPEIGHEEDNVNVKVIFWLAAGLVAFAVVVHLGLAWMFFAFRSAEDREKRSDYPEEFSEGISPLPKAPRLEGIEGRKQDGSRERTGGEIAVSREEELYRYGWVDEKRGIVSIPIDEAFDRLLSKKPKARSDRDAKRFRDRGERVPHDANSGRGQEEER